MGIEDHSSCCTEPRCVCILLENNTYKAHCNDLELNTSSFPEFYGNVTVIFLTDNKIEEFPSSTQLYLPINLRSLVISENILHELKNGSFIGLRSLQHLDLSHNKLRFVDDRTFSWLNSVAEIHDNVSLNNKDALIPTSISAVNRLHEGGCLDALKTLNISYNFLDKLPDSMLLGLYSLQTLDISWNYLKEWTVKCSHLEKFELLNLSSNRISSFHEDTMNDIDKLLLKSNLTIDLTNNIIACTCGSLKFLKWIRKHRNIFLDFKSYDCFDAKTNSFSNIESNIRDLGKTCSDITEL